MFKGRLGIWIFVLILAIGGPWLYENVPVWLHTDDVVVASELTNIDMLDAMSHEKFGHFRVQTTSQDADVIFSHDTTTREGYELVENAVTSPLVLYVRKSVDEYEDGFIQDDNNSYYLRINLNSILTGIEENKTWADIGIHKDVLNGPMTLNIPDENDWVYPQVIELFLTALNGNKIPTEEQRAQLQPRLEAIIKKCTTHASIAQAISDDATDNSKDYKAYIAPEYLFLTCEGMGGDSFNCFVPVYFTKTVSIAANAYLKTGYTDLDLSHGLFEAMRSGKAFMRVTGWRVKDCTFDVTKVWSRFPNVV